MQVPESSWLSLNKRDDLSRALQAGSWGGLCSGDIVHVITIPPPSSPLGLPSENTPLSSSPAERHSSETQTPPVASVVAVAASHTESLVVATASFSPASHVLQSLVVALGLPHPHIRVLRDGSAAARGVDAAHDFSAVAAVVGTAVCILVSSAGGVCTAQLPLLFAATVDAPSDRARDEAWKQVRVVACHSVLLPHTLAIPLISPAAFAASSCSHPSELHQQKSSRCTFTSRTFCQRARACCCISRRCFIAAGARRAACCGSVVHLQVRGTSPFPPL
jgi:hypothetical protein